MKVALCIPCHGDTKADFTFSLARMIATTLTLGTGIELETLIARSSILVQSRTRLFEWSRDWGADKILWLDSDHTFAPQSLLRLLGHDLPMVGANYRRRTEQVVPSAVRRDGNGWSLVNTTPEKARADAIEEVDRIGFGFVLMDVPAIIAALGDAPYPLFETHSLADGTFVGEDSLFCDRLRAAGVPIHVDHGLSLTIGHLDERTLFFPR
ncbi:hypothetical protein M0208_04865 [Sphingomonas sp. SUN019]|uniref:hypothetical protein n=1 Tax=Sphingomonas sp. SUN019 TaxID=2937788 RepID=UPI0021648153|nr:hypothetical protein [Sphingomonas sp. SUN019]UVO49882.1 hypothetical protein M0208_04865 [Sphingomonas sp. SUN019]